MSSTKVILQVGDTAPNFQAVVQNPDGTSKQIDLYEILDENKESKVLLVFYPKDQTPGCTAQLCGIRDIYKDYKDLNVTVFGVNPGSKESHLAFIEKFSYPFGIIVDEDHKIRENYGAIKKIFTATTTKRGVFLIDSDKKIIFQQWGQQDNQEIISLLQNK